MEDLSKNPQFFALLADSHFRLVGAPLLSDNIHTDDPATWLYEAASYCVLAHNADPDPHFIYANKAAQACFGYSWSELTSLPSRLSAETADREKRQQLMDRVRQQGFAIGYTGLRISKTGLRFWIEDATLWQLLDEEGVVHGMAAAFAKWRDA